MCLCVCVCVCVCVCPTERAPVMFCFCQSDSRDGIRSIYLESGITGHCLTVQAGEDKDERDGKGQHRSF